MGLVDWTRRAFSAPTLKAASGVPAQGFLPTLGSTPSAAGVLISQATSMQVSTVHACVTIRSEDTARCTPGLWRVLDDGQRELVKAKDHPIARLLKRPNRAQTWYEFCEQMEAAVLLRGNAYAVIRRDGRGRPTELIAINPDAVMVLEAADGSVFYNVNRLGLWQIAMLRDFPVSIPAEDIFHLRGLSFNTLVAASRIGLARDAIGVAMGLEQQAARWMANGARPAGVLQTDKSLTKDAADRLKTSWNSLFSGIQNVGATAVLEEGLKWQSLSLSSVDLEFLNQRKFQVEEVARFYRVPPHKLAITDGLRGLNLPQADQEYVNDAIMPALERWEQKLEQVFDLDEEGLEIEFDERNLLRADITTRYNAYRIGVLSGFASPNEVRRSERLPPVDGGDEVRAPLNLAALGSDATGTAPDGAGRPASGELPADSVPTN
jgi:HK97 family phage portal protein